MSRIRSKGTKPEKDFFILVKTLWNKGYKYRKHYKKIIGKPDLVFPTKKVAIFIDGEFWHGKDFRQWSDRLPTEYWLKKIKNNIRRDKEVNSELASLGWKVCRFWGKDVKKKPKKILKKIKLELSNK